MHIEEIMALDEMTVEFDGDPHPAAKILVSVALLYRNTLMNVSREDHVPGPACFDWMSDLLDDPCPACDVTQVTLDLGPLRDAWRVYGLPGGRAPRASPGPG
jgi:hypothetical protein